MEINYTNIGNFYTQDGNKQDMNDKLVKMMQVAKHKQLGDVVYGDNQDTVLENINDSFKILHTHGYETTCSIVDYVEDGKAQHKIALTSNYDAISPQHYLAAFDLLSNATEKDGDGFNLESLVVTDEKLLKQRSGKMPDGLDRERLTDVFNVKNLYGYKENVAEINCNFRLSEPTDNRWVLNSIGGALGYLQDFYLSDIERAKKVSLEIQREKSEMER